VAVPEVYYARSRGGHVAYQSAGEGPPVVVMVIGSGSTSLLWEEPWSARFLTRLESFCQLVTFDQRGTGRSDPIDPAQPPLVEERVADLTAVLDAATTSPVTLFGFHDGGPVATMFAAANPERVQSLILCNTWARLTEAPDYPWGVPSALFDLGTSEYSSQWGRGESLDWLAPSLAADPTIRRGWARHEQLSHSPGQNEALSRVVAHLDVRDVLSAVRAPTLVLHTTKNRVIDVRHGRFLADHIEGARFVGLPSADHLVYVSSDARVADEIEQFVTGERRSRLLDRSLATVLFTDIVDSTPRLAASGDGRWRTVLDLHDDVVRRELAIHRGEEVAWTGDGFLATFDGPARAVRCAQSILSAMNARQLSLRAGLHTGEIERRGREISGITVHIANRVAREAGPGEVLVSSTVRDLVAGSGLSFESRGIHALKGVPDPKELLRLVG
jgi:class 3 adenylate cyclase